MIIHPFMIESIINNCDDFNRAHYAATKTIRVIVNQSADTSDRNN